MKRATLPFYLVFFLSGASALAFETLWFRLAGLALGNSVWAGSMVLSSFMAGLALGNLFAGRFGHRVKNPIRMYGLLEIVIGAAGVALVLLLPEFNSILAPVLRPWIDQPEILNPLRLGISFTLLLPATMAMGATLPLMVKGLKSADVQFGERLGRLYACNTLGAMAGAMICEMLLITHFGLLGSGYVAGGINLLIGLFAIAVGKASAGETTPQTQPVSEASQLTVRSVRILFGAMLSGGILLALEVVWFRYLLLFQFGTSQVFAVMLAVVLSGIALGGLLAARWLRTHKPSTAIPLLAVAGGVLTLLSYALPSLAVVSLQLSFKLDHSGLTTLMQSLIVMLPVSTVSGALFTMMGQALHEENSSETKAAGYLTLFNTTGAMLGALLGGFVFLPHLGIQNSFIILSVSYVVVSALTLPKLEFMPRVPALGAMTATAALVAGICFFPKSLDTALFLKVSNVQSDRNTRLVALREGLTDTVMYSQQEWFGHPLYHRLITNSHSMSGTTPAAWQYMKQYVYLPAAIHPNMKKACLISFGCGVTARALTDNSELSQIDIVDISKDILDLNDVVYPDPADQPLKDPRVRVFIEDGRFFLQTTGEAYDLITSEPPPPKGANVVNLYTKEYFQLIHDRLAPGGMTSYWLPLHSLNQQDSRVIVRAFCEVFEDSSLWLGSGDNWLLLGIREGQVPVTEEQFRAQWNDSKVRPILKASGFECPEQLGSYFIGDRETMMELVKDELPLVDNFPHRLSPATSTAGVESRYAELLAADACRERFLKSPHVKRLWPASMIEPSLEYFDQINWIHDIWIRQRSRVSEIPAFSLEAIHALLTESDLEMAPLWALGSGYRDQLVVDKVIEEGRANEWVYAKLGHRYLARREYAKAGEIYDEALADMPQDSMAYQMNVLRRAFVFCMLDQAELAGELLQKRLSNQEIHEELQRDLEFLQTKFGVPALGTTKSMQVAAQ